MSYANARHRGRLVLLARLEDAFAELYAHRNSEAQTETHLAVTSPPVVMYKSPEIGASGNEGHVYNFPFLLHKTGLPWNEANAFLLDLVRHKSVAGRPTDDIRRLASKLLDYLLFCEDAGIDWLDFSGRRPALRPTYRYFAYLNNATERSGDVVNQYTGAVYRLYEFVSKMQPGFDLGRVDTVREVKLMFDGASGKQVVTVKKRGQTNPRRPQSSVKIGFVRDEGEELRPLANFELREFMRIIQTPSWTPQERLIFLMALMTGARKQTVLTLRVKHLQAFATDRILNDGTYAVHVGPGTGCDTKRNQKQTIYVPRQLAEDIQVWVNSPEATTRRRKFRSKYQEQYPQLPEMSEEDAYIFLSDQGGCYYMGRDDPRYIVVSSKPKGQVTDTLRSKLNSKVSGSFPGDFTYHWLRATFSFQLHQRIQPLIASGELPPGEDISFIQGRMHHRDRKVTEHYLKLFTMHSEKLRAQEIYEGYLFGFSRYDDLKMDELDD